MGTCASGPPSQPCVAAACCFVATIERSRAERRTGRYGDQGRPVVPPVGGLTVALVLILDSDGSQKVPSPGRTAPTVRGHLHGHSLTAGRLLCRTGPQALSSAQEREDDDRDAPSERRTYPDLRPGVRVQNPT